MRDKMIITPKDILRAIIYESMEKNRSKETVDLCRYGRIEISKINKLYCFEKEMMILNDILDFDQTKLIIDVTQLGFTGFEISEILEMDYEILVDQQDSKNILFIITEEHDKKYIEDIIKALKDISETYRATRAICR